jgi:hypothetical protein
MAASYTFRYSFTSRTDNWVRKAISSTDIPCRCKATTRRKVLT